MAGAAGLLALGLVGGWALRVMLAPAPDVLDSPAYTLVAARQSTVEQSLRLNTSAVWSPERVVPNQAAGVVTSVDLVDGTLTEPSTVLYTVDLRPVAVATGEVPAFRDLSVGVTGSDVAQLQGMLSARGLYSGNADGVFDGGVGAAVRAWQRGLRVTADGVVRRGDIVYVPRLPARLALGDALSVGASITGGEPAVEVLPDEPRFSITMTAQHAQLVTADMAVEISYGGSVWPAVVEEVRQQADDGQFVALLSSADGSICGAECATVPFGDPELMPSVIHVVPAVSGVTVPTVALVTDASGEVGVVLANGDFLAVTVVASANGIAVVDGLTVGQRVRAPGESSP